MPDEFGGAAPGVTPFQRVGVATFAAVNHVALYLERDVRCNLSGNGASAADGFSRLDQGRCLRPLGRSDQVESAQLVLLTPSSPVVFAFVPVQNL